MMIYIYYSIYNIGLYPENNKKSLK